MTAFLLPPTPRAVRLPVKPATPPAPHHHETIWPASRRRTAPLHFMDQGDGQSEPPPPQQQQQLNPLDELERNLKGVVPTVYVTETPQGRMKIPLPPVSPREVDRL